MDKSGNECIRGVRPRRDIEYEAATLEKKRKSIEKIHTIEKMIPSLKQQLTSCVTDLSDTNTKYLKS